MHSCSGFCQACNRAVELVLKDVVPKLALPLATAGLGLGVASSKKARARNGVVGSAIGLGIGFIADLLTPSVQKWVCGDCGCDGVVVA